LTGKGFSPGPAVRLFPWLALGMAGLAYAFPSLFARFGFLIAPLLGVVMFAMGSTLTAADFARVLERPKVIALGIVLHFFLMPLLAFLIAHALHLSPELTAGLILVGSLWSRWPRSVAGDCVLVIVKSMAVLP